MRALKIKSILFIAVFMFAAKPFVGFNLCNHIQTETNYNIVVKAFTKRKQEYVEDSEYDIAVVQLLLVNPVFKLNYLFSFLLDQLFPAILNSIKALTSNIVADIYLSLIPQRQRYLLSGKLII